MAATVPGRRDAPLTHRCPMKMGAMHYARPERVA